MRTNRLGSFLRSLLSAGLLIGGLASAVSAQGVSRHGHITWQQTSSGVVEFTIQNVWRRSAYGDKCVSPVTERFVPCSGRGGAPGIGDLILELEGSTTFDPGDDSLPIGSPALMYLVTAVDVDANWILGLALDPASLPQVDTTIDHVYADEIEYRAFTCPIDDVCMFLVPAVEPNAVGLAGAHALSSAQVVVDPLTQPLTTTLPSPLTTTLPSPVTTTVPSPVTTTAPSPVGEPISNTIASRVALDFLNRLIDGMRRRSNAAGISRRDE